MNRLGDVWTEVIRFDNLYLAWRKARRGKRARVEVAGFALNLERELLELQSELVEGRYRPGPYRSFLLFERKPRLISAAPFRDRVVQHAVMNVIEPPLDRGFIPDSYACRTGRGVHAAVDRYQAWARRYAYVLKLDIRRYFPSVDHQILKRQLRRRLKDARVLALLDLIIDSWQAPADSSGSVTYFPGDDLFSPLDRPRGIPIGNLTSQFFANLYLDSLDHCIKEMWRIPAYLRYVDDLVFLADSKRQLWAVAAHVRDFLQHELRLEVHPRKLQLMRSSERVDLFGYLISPTRRWLRNDNGHRFARRLHGLARAYARGRVDWRDVQPSIRAWIGHASHGETLGLRQEIFSSVVFCRNLSTGDSR